jgi:hypothetical protein
LRTFQRLIMPQALWTKLFLEEQGFQIQPIKVLQDNKSAYAVRGEWQEMSSSKRTGYIQVWYYVVTDQVANQKNHNPSLSHKYDGS